MTTPCPSLGSKKIRVLQINGRGDLSGGPISMLRLIERMNPDTFENIVLCPDEPRGIFRKLEQCSNARIFPMSFRSIKDIGNFWKILKLVKKNHVDMIHSHGKAAGLYGRILGKLMGIQVIHQLHGIHYKQYSRPLQFLYLKIEALLSRWSHRIICVSQSELEQGLSLKLFKRSQAIVIHNGIDTQNFKKRTDLKKQLRKKWQVPQNAKVIVSITRYCYQKNPELSLRVLARLSRKHKDLYLFFIGLPSNQDKLNYLAKKLNIADRVIYTGTLANVNELLNIGDIYLSTSRWEGFSLGLIEAMSSELPIVLSNVVGNNEFLHGENDGTFFVQYNATNGYVYAIDQLLKNDILKKDSGRRARFKVKKYYNINDMVRNTEMEYMKVMGDISIMPQNKKHSEIQKMYDVVL